jgi:NADPH-dependent F420 reductase
MAKNKAQKQRATTYTRRVVMKVAIIGTGNIGSGLARVLTNTENEVVVADRGDGSEAVKKLAKQDINVKGADVASAVKEAELVILATYYNAIEEIADQVDFSGKIVVDLSNPVTADFSALQLGHTSSAAEEIARQLPGAKVVKAFNTIFAEHYATGLKIDGKKLQTFIAGDDASALAAVQQLAEDIGLEPVVAGPLSNARYLEPLGFLNIQFGYVLGHGTTIAPHWLAQK